VIVAPDTRENDMTRTIWIRALEAACVGTIGFGLVATAAARPETDGLWAWLFSLVSGRETIVLNDEARLASAILGGVMASWAWMMLALTRQIGRRVEGAHATAVQALVIWFVIDSTGSVLSGWPGNVALNVVFALLFAVPLAMLRPGRTAAAPA